MDAGLHRRAFLLGLAASASSLLGCAGGVGMAGMGGQPQMGDLMAARGGRGASGGGAPNFDDMMARQRLQMDMMNSPDLPAWHDAREKMALALGDRTFSKPFDRVFDSMTVALATLGSRVANMERTSGYIGASIPNLGPAQTTAMHEQGMRQYASAKGYPASVTEKSGNRGFDVDMSGMMMRQGAGMTLSLLRQGAARTKVKLRFDNVFYPEMVAEYYKLVWAAVDKQMFLDGSLD